MLATAETSESFITTFRKVDHHIAGTAMCGRTAIFPQGFCVNKKAEIHHHNAVLAVANTAF